MTCVSLSVESIFPPSNRTNFYLQKFLPLHDQLSLFFSFFLLFLFHSFKIHSRALSFLLRRVRLIRFDKRVLLRISFSVSFFLEMATTHARKRPICTRLSSEEIAKKSISDISPVPSAPCFLNSRAFQPIFHGWKRGIRRLVPSRIPCRFV